MATSDQSILRDFWTERPEPSKVKLQNVSKSKGPIYVLLLWTNDKLQKPI